MSCIHEKDCPGAVPFYVGNNSQVTTARYGYAPTYCPYCPDYREAPIQFTERTPEKVIVKHHYIQPEIIKAKEKAKTAKGIEI